MEDQLRSQLTIRAHLIQLSLIMYFIQKLNRILKHYNKHGQNWHPLIIVYLQYDTCTVIFETSTINQVRLAVVVNYFTMPLVIRTVYLVTILLLIVYVVFVYYYLCCCVE